MIKQYAGLALLAVCLAASGCAHKKVTTATVSTNPVVDTTNKVEPQPPRPPAGHADDEKATFIWTDVHFAYDDASLSDEAKNILSSTGSYLSKHPQHVE